MTVRRWLIACASGLALVALTAALAAATLRGGAPLPERSIMADSEVEEEGEEEEEAEGGEDYFSLQRIRTTRNVEAGYRRALSQARRLASGATAASARLRGAWQFVGPTNVGGRLTDIAIDPTQPDTVYVTAASGGVWKSEDAGRTLRSVWPATLPQGAGAVAVDGTGRVWVGTGEANPGGGSSTYPGTGMYVSDDGGGSWRRRGLPNSNRIGRIVIDPTNRNRVFVAAGGPLYTTGGQRGIYRTDNGGASWKRVLAPETPTAGGAEIALDPTNPRRIFATMWDRMRTPAFRTYGGTGSGLYRSLDGGTTWKRLDRIVALTPGDSVGLARHEQLGRLGVAVAPSDPDRVYVLTGSYGGYGSFKGFYVSHDGGDTFTTTAALPNPRGDLWWTGQVWVDPANADHVFIPGVDLLESADGGDSWHESEGMHVDHHAIEWDPRVPNRVYEGNDGGLYRSDANGATNTWQKATYEPYTQHYTVDVAEPDPSRVSGGLQDQGCVRSWSPTAPPSPSTWNDFGCGDGLYTPIDPSDPNIYYGCSQYGNCTRYNDNLIGQPGERRNIGSRTISQRRNWKTPLVIDPNDPATLYYGGDVLNRSTDRGETWTPISPVENPLPGRPTELDPVYTNYGTITAVGVAKTLPDTIYVGTDTGRLWKTGDGGQSWLEFKARGLPIRWVSAIAVDPRNEQRAYVTYTGFFQGDDTALVFLTTNGGETWRNVSGNLPNAPVNDVVLDRDAVYVGTDVGVYYQRRGERDWRPLGRELPLAPVLDLRLHGPTREVYAATFGRGVYKHPVESRP
jgi:photosystem II stability/assembly factor-like uncharacterized protein